MILFGLVFLLAFGVPSGGLGWYGARRLASWRKTRVVFLAALPVPAIAVVAGLGAIAYGTAIKGTCGYDDCGGFIFLGILCMATAIMGYGIGLAFAAIGAIIERAGDKPSAEIHPTFD